MSRWVHVDADSAHKEWIAASRCKFRGIEVNKHATFIDVPSWMWAVSLGSLKCISYLMGYHTCLGGPSSTA
eukprot:COSAG02_NODE_4352_length_5461_cov_11.457665_1_plen_70_part_10